MGKRMQSWFFFAALMLFLLAAAVSIPDLGERLFGATEQRLEDAAEQAEARIQTVWANLTP